MTSVDFELLPAIDLSGGRIARMRGGDPSSLEFDTAAPDPFEVARGFVADGARWIHVVDLDAAMGTGRSAAGGQVLRRIAALPVRIQAGGGLEPAAVERALADGAERAVVGAGWLGAVDRPAVEALVRRYPDRVAIGLDVRGDTVMPRGGARPSAPLEPILDWLAAAPVRPVAVVVTEVDRDSTLEGVDVARLVEIGARASASVVASGGIGSLADLRALAAAWPAIRGAIVGRALADGVFGIREALQAVARGDD